MQELNGLFGKIPKESFELLQRNIDLRQNLEKLYEEYKRGLSLRANDFDTIFNGIFRFFFRPLELSILASKPLMLLLPTAENLNLYEVTEETFKAYEDFLKSLKDHFDLTVKIFEQKFSNPFIDEIAHHFDFKQSELKLGDLTFMADYPYILTNRAIEHITASIDSWRRFTEDYSIFKSMMVATFRRAVEEFLEGLEEKRAESYAEFAARFYDVCAKHFDSLLASENYISVQRSMNSNLMDHLYHFRRFYEELLENSPANPFATVGQVDEAYKRITDLKRRVAEIERRLKELEVRE